MIQRERVYIDILSEEEVDENELVDDREYSLSITNNFNIVDMTEDQFRTKILDIFKSRFS